MHVKESNQLKLTFSATEESLTKKIRVLGHFDLSSLKLIENVLVIDVNSDISSNKK